MAWIMHANYRRDRLTYLDGARTLIRDILRCGGEQMSVLEKTRPTLLNVVNAISTVIGADVVIADDKARLLVSSEGYMHRKGTGAWGPFIDYVVKSGAKMVIDNPGFHYLCAGCPNEKHCPQTIELLSPFAYKERVIGYISLVSFSSAQREEFLARQNEILGFLEQMGQLIVYTVAEKEIGQRLLQTMGELQATINSVHYGIVTCDARGKVTHCNNPASSLLGLTEEKIVGQDICTMLPRCTTISKVLERKENAWEQEWKGNVQGRWVHFVISGQPILGPSGSADGGVFVLQDIKGVHRLVHQISGQEIEYTLDDIIGVSSEVEVLRQQIAAIAPSSSTVLITGESGTGKELVARALHALSPRRHKPFVAINCCAIPDTLLESELFGYEEGAFTGAKRGGKAGKFELANGGTLFLDEIGDMPMYLQAKLLRVLQERAIERIGGAHPVPLEVRVIAATNQDLEAKIRNNEFREDLFYRINVIPLFIPPLRERKSDILPLASHFMRKYQKILRKHIQGIAPEFQETILEYEWPGNVRELENAVEYAVNVETGPVLTRNSLPQRIRDAIGQSNNGLLPAGDLSIERQVKSLETKLVRQAVQRYGLDCDGKAQAAKALGVSRATFYRKLKEAGICVS